MSYPLFKRIVVLLFITALLYWDTLSLWGSEGAFNAEIYQANSEQFFLIAPALLLLWVARHLLPDAIADRLMSRDRTNR